MALIVKQQQQDHNASIYYTLARQEKLFLTSTDYVLKLLAHGRGGIASRGRR